MSGSNPALMSGVSELLILRLLSQRSMYGYELVKTIRLATGEAISLGEGVVYPILHSLERAGALRTRRKKISGRTRVYYSVTAKGRRRLSSLTEDWERISVGLQTALGEAVHG